MGNRVKKIQELNIFWRKVILFTAVFILAVPLTAFIVKRFSARTLNVSSENMIQNFEISEELGESFLQIQEATKELQEQLNATTTTSTDSTSTETF